MAGTIAIGGSAMTGGIPATGGNASAGGTIGGPRRWWHDNIRRDQDSGLDRDGRRQQVDRWAGGSGVGGGARRCRLWWKRRWLVGEYRRPRIQSTWLWQGHYRRWQRRGC